MGVLRPPRPRCPMPGVFSPDALLALVRQAPGHTTTLNAHIILLGVGNTFNLGAARIKSAMPFKTDQAKGAGRAVTALKVPCKPGSVKYVSKLAKAGDLFAEAVVANSNAEHFIESMTTHVPAILRSLEFAARPSSSTTPRTSPACLRLRSDHPALDCHRSHLKHRAP